MKLIARWKLLAVSLLSATSCACSFAGEALRLPTLHADAARTSISGLSSGGFMASQYSVAYSASVIGVGIVAGGPYGCVVSQGLLVPAAIPVCMEGTPSSNGSWLTAQSLASAWQIDPLKHIADQRVYIFTGTNDLRVHSSAVAATRDFYATAGVPPKYLKYVDSVPAGHAFIAPTAKNACDTSGPPYIDQCKVGGRAYDQPKEILQHIYGRLTKPAVVPSGTLRPFDQREFASESSGLAEFGFFYMPKACTGAAASACAVHVVFHGCKQTAGDVGTAVYGALGYNRWADTNHLIVLYPQIGRTAGNEGCWDWVGYTYLGIPPPLFLAFLTKNGVQLSAIKAMVDRLAAPN